PLESPERFILPTIRPLAKRNNKSGGGNGSEAVVDSRREGAQREEENNSSGSENRTGSVPGSAQASPLARHSLTDGTKSPGSGSMYSSLDTPDLSPRNGAKRSNNNTSTESSTPESFEIINPIRHLEKQQQQQPTRSDSPYSFSTTSSQRRHRELPKSAVPMSAVSPQSTSSIDHYLDSISFSNNSGSISAEPLERWPVGPSPPPSENPFSASAMEAFRKAHQGVSTFAPSHMPASAPGPAETTTTTTTTTAKVAPKKLVFPPLKVEEKPESMKEVKILTASIRERRNSMPSPSGLSPDLMNRRPSAPSPLTGGPSTILFTPSAHQPLHAALSSYSSSSRPRALDDSNIRGSNLSIKTDHIRTAPRRGLVPYTPFSQGSDSFSPATALLTGAKSSKMPLTGIKTSMVPNSALSTSVSVKLATRARTRPPSGPRKPRHSNSTKSKDKIPMIPMIEESVLSTSRSRSVSESQARASISPYPPTPTFETQLVRFKGLTLDVAKWTFSQEELQEVTRRAICHSSDPMSIRLLPAKILDEDIPAELERLVLQREELKANYKYQYRRRMGVLKSLSAMSEHPEGTMNGSVAARLVEDLMDIGIKSDQIGEEMYVVSDQIAQLRALQESHSASALAMALRKINSSFIKVQAEVADLKSQVAD
ncbi:7887_t:CDS:2, partial [Acaulospora colombiana]